ncbi:MAG TPA: phosphate-starvation-inducible PsiE family protein [Gammaproteobacteria bacterium]|nr:phosphate-starvation-inducible PsiE family protein [Gammaproteobacteria bacterium]
MKFNSLQIFEKVIGVVLNVMLLFITLGIIIGVLRLFLNMGDLLGEHDITVNYLHIISDVLTLFVLIELSRSLVDYFTTHRLRMTFIVDAGIVFLLREVMIGIFEHKITPQEIYSLSALLFVLGALRIGSVLVFQRERSMLDIGAKRER